MKIEDGKGSGRQASVSNVQRLNVSAKTQSRIFYATRDFGLGFVAVYDPISAVAGDHIVYLKNSSTTKNLFITNVELSSVEAAVFKTFGVTGTAASGELITPANLNRSSNLNAEATCMRGDTAITGLTTDNLLGISRNSANGETDEDYKGALILGPNDAIVIEYDSGTAGSCSASIFFWYENIGAS